MRPVFGLLSGDQEKPMGVMLNFASGNPYVELFSVDADAPRSVGAGLLADATPLARSSISRSRDGLAPR
ncbi:hypothetical protein BN2475_110048 [Paraburkholderia ribeironis]|uniref:Uncharacterized protein n=1 Tax=Paraburkholderia ribeironis TaxID=1247936 RepID=A0A1N7RQD2_9BURK|nr:hypothetical protein BN2475_110048 [Paraburkholderia ribeironis]